MSLNNCFQYKNVTILWPLTSINKIKKRRDLKLIKKLFLILKIHANKKPYCKDKKDNTHMIAYTLSKDSGKQMIDAADHYYNDH